MKLHLNIAAYRNVAFGRLKDGAVFRITNGDPNTLYMKVYQSNPTRATAVTLSTGATCCISDGTGVERVNGMFVEDGANTASKVIE